MKGILANQNIPSLEIISLKGHGHGKAGCVKAIFYGALKTYHAKSATLVMSQLKNEVLSGEQENLTMSCHVIKPLTPLIWLKRRKKTGKIPSKRL